MPWGILNRDIQSVFHRRAHTWIAQNLAYLYTDLYDQLGLTEYTDYDVGPGRANVALGVDIYAATTPPDAWKQFLAEKLGSHFYSDVTFGPFHGGTTGFGGRGVLSHQTTAREIYGWTSAAGRKWRMRKVALWACYAGLAGSPALTNTTYISFYEAFGLRPTQQQIDTFMRKNGGVFLGGDLYQANNFAQIEATLDEYWVAGLNPWPGACDPYYSLFKVYKQTIADYPTALDAKHAQPILGGYPWMNYTGLYDDELMGNVMTHVH